MIHFQMDGVKHEFDAGKLGNVEAIELEKFAGLKTQEFYTGLSEVRAVALTALVWLTLKREGEQIAFSEMDFDLMEVMKTFEDDDSEEEPDVEVDPTESSSESLSELR